MASAARPPYNQRLFGSGVRKHFHMARFKWVERTLRRLGCPADSVLELGCFDGRLLDHLPRPPLRYKGFDANWEGGLDLALSRRGNAPGRVFLRASKAADMTLDPGETFDLAVCLETLEHVPPAEVELYLHKIAIHLNGYLLITVPNEIGMVFLVKWAVKRLFSRGRTRYGISEVLWSFLGRTHRVPRHEHKGFDYRDMIDSVSRYFDIIAVEGHPGRWLPVRLCFGVGIVALSRSGGSISNAITAVQ